jgi:hypothetical protein
MCRRARVDVINITRQNWTRKSVPYLPSDPDDSRLLLHFVRLNHSEKYPMNNEEAEILPALQEGQLMRTQLDKQSVISANSQFWEQMLAMKLEPVPMAEIFCVGTRHLLGSVELSGMWNCRIEVRIDERLAYVATAAMLMQPVDSVVQADMLDATKEIANMIAGVLKSSLPRPCAMTVPESAMEADRVCALQRSENTLAVGFRHSDDDLMVCVSEHD